MVSPAKFAILTYLYSFNPFIDISETGKYLSHNNV